MNESADRHRERLAVNPGRPMEQIYLLLLQTQRDLYRLAMGMDRFREYLDTLIDKDADDIRLPLSGMNPMGQDHVPSFLDALLAMDADATAVASVGRARAETAGESGVPHESAAYHESGAYRICLVATDDLKGGWTNRYAVELGNLLGERDLHKRGWLTVPLWTSETYTTAKVAASVLACVHRKAYAQCHGYPENLGGILAQETAVMAAIPERGEMGTALDAEEAAYTWEALRTLYGASDPPTLIAALFGDEAARQLGHSPLGLSPRAGLMLALADSDRQASIP
jgi:hypothetical protein